MKITTYVCDICGNSSRKTMASVKTTMFKGALCMLNKTAGADHVCDECGKAMADEVKAAMERAVSSRRPRPSMDEGDKEC
jgi:hypothetical protein